MDIPVKITFYGGVETVTGSNFLLEADGKKILVDCGLTQGTKLAEDVNWSPFVFNPGEIDILIITHAHVDHIGRIPKLVNEGFNGKIYSTLPTKDLSVLMLEDTAAILSKSDKFNLEQIYNPQNIKKALSLWSGFNYHEKIKVTDKVEITLKNAGHILGSAMINFTINGKKIVFTGDLGNSPSPLLPDNEKITDADYLIMESVYGDRNHESRDDRQQALMKVIKENYDRKGTLIIPVFSLERSQELLFELNHLVESKKMPVMPVILDSPLAIHLTEIFKKYKNYFNEKAQKSLHTGDQLFDFPGLRSTLQAEESKLISTIPNPKIVIAGSGMSAGGRIVHHEKHYLPDPNNTLLLIGYQSVGTPGRLIQEGIKNVRIGGDYVDVRAHIATISGYSGHKDSDGLLNFALDTGDSVRKIFIVMGEPRSSMFLVQKLRDQAGINAYAPEPDESVILSC